MPESRFKIEADIVKIRQIPVNPLDATNKEYVDTSFNAIVGSAISDLNTLGKIALALNNDPNIANNLNELIGEETQTREDEINAINEFVDDTKSALIFDISSEEFRAIKREEDISLNLSTEITNRQTALSDLSDIKFPISKNGQYFVDDSMFTIASDAYLKIGTRWRIKCNTAGSDTSQKSLAFEYYKDSLWQVAIPFFGDRESTIPSEFNKSTWNININSYGNAESKILFKLKSDNVTLEAIDISNDPNNKTVLYTGSLIRDGVNFKYTRKTGLNYNYGGDWALFKNNFTTLEWQDGIIFNKQ